MKFSVLIPTRDRLEYFRHAVHSVLQQDYDDWEVVVSDNASSEDYRSYVSGLADARIVYSRSAEGLSVTDNWNRALSMSSGEYVVMLGDDDGLMQGYFRTIAGIITDHPNAELVYTGGLLYAYPGVMPGFPDGYLQPCGYASFLVNAVEPAVLAKDEALDAARSAFRFRATYPFNAQFVVMSRSYIVRESTAGPLYRSPYPDFYAMNVAMLRAREIVTCPLPLVVVGVTPRSFGYYYFNARESDGIEMLGTNAIIERSSASMPGSKHLCSWLAALLEVRATCTEVALVIDLRRYRLLQAGFVFRRVYLTGAAHDFPLREFWRSFPLPERAVMRAGLSASAAIIRRVPPALRARLIGGVRKLARSRMKDAAWEEASHLEGSFGSLRDVVDTVRPEGTLLQRQVA